MRAPRRVARYLHWFCLTCLTAVFTLGLAACAGPTGEGPTHPAQTPTDTARTDVQPRDDLRHEHTVEWSRYEKLNDRTIRVYFLLDNPSCYGAHAQAHETATSIEISVIVGTLPDAPPNCAENAATVSILVATTTPIADRSIVHS